MSEPSRHQRIELVRKATPSDLAQMVTLGYRLCDKTIYKDVQRDRPAIVRMFSQSMSSQFACAFVTERDGALSGMIVGMAQQLWWSKARYATDLVFYSEYAGDGYRLLKRFLSWAWRVPGVVEVTLGQSSGLEAKRTGAIYRRAGLAHAGGMWTAMKPGDLP